MYLLSTFSLRNRALIALLTIVIGLFGGVAITLLKQELIPSITLPQLAIVTNYPGATPAVVEHDVSTPIESAIQGVPGLDSTTTTSSSSLSSITVAFKYGTDLTYAQQKVELAISQISSTLPSGVTPQVFAGSLADLPVVVLAVTSSDDAQTLADRLNNSVVPDIEKLSGVRAASVLGASGQRITITPNLTKLFVDGYTTQSISAALKANGSLIAAGSITENGQTLVVQSGTAVTAIDQVQQLPLLGGRVPATIADVADVALVANPVTGYSRVNGTPSLSVSITKTPDGNTVDVSKAVNAKLADLRAEIGGDAKITVVFDQAPYIEQSIESLATEGLLGLGFAVVVILIFLLSIRSTLVTAISIPVSVLVTFIGMLASGYSLNILTLGALTIAIGRVVDDSIVVIENIKRHLGLGEPKLQAISSAVREVATAVTASTITTVAVFLPLALVGDVTGELFRPFAITVTIALASSLFVALTIVPVLAYWFLPLGKASKHLGAGAVVDGGEAPELAAAEPQRTGAHAIAAPAAATLVPSAAAPSAAAPSARISHEDELERPSALQRAYLPIIRGTLAHPLVTILLAVLVLFGSGAAAGALQTNFIGNSGQNTLTVTQKLAAGASLDAQNDAAKQVEAALLAVPHVKTVATTLGSAGSSFAALFGAGSSARFSVTTQVNADQTAVQDAVRAKLKTLSGVGDVELASSGGFGSSSIDVIVKAPDAEGLSAAAKQVLDAVKDLSVTAQATSDLATTQPYLSITVDRAKAAAAGVSESTVGGIVAGTMLPVSSGTAAIGDSTINIYIENPSKPTTQQELQDFLIPTAKGQVPLSSIATVSVQQTPASITAERGIRTATVSVTPKGQSTGTASAAVNAALTKLKLPAGASWTLGGVASQQSDAFGQLGLALLAAILIVYTVMVATFRSLLQPLLLLVSVPFAATGAILLQLASGVPLGVASLIGVLMLIGIVVTNAIVLVDLVNQYRDRGMPMREAIVHGTARRLRPILMTALATIFALVPMAVGLTGGGGFISQPLAIVVIGGLLSSTLLTLVVLPTLYWLVLGRSARRAERAARTAASASSAS